MLKVYHPTSHTFSFLPSDICFILPYVSFASCFSVIWGKRYDLLIGLSDTILTLTVMLKINAFPSRDGSSSLQVIWKVHARCIFGSQIIPVCFFMLTGWPYNSSSLRMGISWLWSFPCFSRALVSDRFSMSIRLLIFPINCRGGAQACNIILFMIVQI